ncbi:hypothetical protein BGZ70_000308, partial [Mortierella alpina]
MKASVSSSHRTSRFARLLPVQRLLTAGVIALILSAALMPAESLPTALHPYPRADPLPSSVSSSIPVPTVKPKQIPVQPIKGKGPPKKGNDNGDNNNDDTNDDEEDEEDEEEEEEEEADHYVKTRKLDFKILNPAPHDVWTSGTLESLSWVDTNLPDETTFDVALIPVDKETNPDALKLTRRPVLRYIAAPERFSDILVPYDLISQEQLLKEQEGEGGNTNQDLANITMVSTNSTALPTTNARNSTTATATTNKVLLQRSVFPIVIRKDHALDWRKASQLPPILSSETSFMAAEGSADRGAEEEVLEKKDSEGTHLEDHDHEHEENEDEDTVENTSTLTGEKAQDQNQDHNRKTQDSHGNTEEEQIEDEDEINKATPTGKELEENEDEDESTDHSAMHMGDEHEHNEQGEAGEDEHSHGHGNDPIHRHMDDPNHFQSEEDLELWNAHADDPGYNPPVPVRDAGTLKITHWIDNKERFFVGAPYVLAWDFPESGKGLDGTVNVYVEDALTAKRYDIAAAEMLSDIQFMYLRPTPIMMSADPRRRIFLRARVELDLFKEGKIERYTGFSKAFWWLVAAAVCQFPDPEKTIGLQALQ